MSEQHLVAACLVWLRLHKCLVWRMNTGAGYYGKPGQRQRFVKFGFVGCPDVMFVLPGGRAGFIECKIGKNAPTWAQAQFLQQARTAGALTGVVYTLDDLEALVRGVLAGGAS